MIIMETGNNFGVIFDFIKAQQPEPGPVPVPVPDPTPGGGGGGSSAIETLFSASTQTWDLLAILFAVLFIVAIGAMLALWISKKQIKFTLPVIVASLMFAILFNVSAAYGGANHIDPEAADEVPHVNAYVDESTGKITVDNWDAEVPVPNFEEGDAIFIKTTTVMAGDGNEDLDVKVKVSSENYEIFDGLNQSSFYPWIWADYGETLSFEIECENPEDAIALIDQENALSFAFKYEVEKRPSDEEELTALVELGNCTVSDKAKKIIEENGWEGNISYTKNLKYNTPTKEVIAFFNKLISANLIKPNQPGDTLWGWDTPGNGDAQFITRNNFYFNAKWGPSDITTVPVTIYLTESFDLTEKGKMLADKESWKYYATEHKLVKGDFNNLDEKLYDIMKLWTADTVQNIDGKYGFAGWLDCSDGSTIAYNRTLKDYATSGAGAEIMVYPYELKNEEAAQEATGQEAAADVTEVEEAAEEPATEAEAQPAPAAEAEAVAAAEPATDVESASAAKPALTKIEEAVVENGDLAEAGKIILSLLFLFLI